MVQHRCNVRYVPKADIACLLEHLVGKREGEKSSQERRIRSGRRAAKKTKHWYRRLLPASCKRPSDSHAIEKGDELASPHGAFPLLGLGQQSTTSILERCGLVQDSKINSPMSALGQKQTWPHVRSMSALPPKADIG